MNVLVSGGAGYIGSHTSKALAAAGFEPIVLDDLSAGHAWAVQWGLLIQGDIGDRDLVVDVLDRYQIEAVVHFAAHAYVSESMRMPSKYFRNNVVKTLSLLDAMLEAGTRRIVFSSSCATYGIPSCLPIGEDHPQFPINPYGESKLFIERTLQWYTQAYNLGVVSLRYFNAAGADPAGEIGECHTPETHLIPIVIQAATGLRASTQIFGTNYPTADGTAIRDYIHVSDLASAHVKALEYLLDGGQSTSINLGTGEGHSVMDVVRSVERVSSLSVPITYMPRRAGDPPVLSARIEKAESVLGWSPRITQLDHIVNSAWEWHRKSRVQATMTAR